MRELRSSKAKQEPPAQPHIEAKALAREAEAAVATANSKTSTSRTKTAPKKKKATMNTNPSRVTKSKATGVKRKSPPVKKGISAIASSDPDVVPVVPIIPEEPIAPAKVEKTTVETTTSKPEPKKGAAAKKPKAEAPEKRLRIFRKHAPQTFQQKLFRAETQRMIVIRRERCGSDLVPEEKIGIVGTTGNIYEVHIQLVPTCTCPDSRKGNQCKHFVYVMRNVLKAPPHLQYQLAFLTSELREIFTQAPPIPDATSDADTEHPGTRKPIEGDCPICFTEFEPESSNEEIVWCKALCGNNIHKTCFEQWERATRGEGRGVRCVYCRTPWLKEVDVGKASQLERGGQINHEGYVNVASEVGLSGERDSSTYHWSWDRNRKSYGRRW